MNQTEKLGEVEQILYDIMREHPELCGNRSEALHELLCTRNDDHQWKNGRIVRTTPVVENTPGCDPERWWRGVSENTLPQTVIEHMQNRRARIEDVRNRAHQLVNTPGKTRAQWLPERGSLLLSEPAESTPEWTRACNEVWAEILSNHYWNTPAN